MKSIPRIILTCVLFLFLALQSVTLVADPPDPPPPPGGGHGSGGDVAAPIDGGLAILLALGAGYGSRRIYRIYREDKGVKKD